MSWKESLPVIGRLYRQRTSLREEVRWLQAALSETRADLAQARDQLTRTTCNRLSVEQLIEDIKRLSNEPTLVLDAQAREIRDQFVEFLGHIHPADLVGSSKIRVGGPHDGGYVMIDDFSASRNAISLGIGWDASWDLDIATRGLRVLQFDDTIETPPVDNPRFLFQKKKVVAHAVPPDEISVAEILKLEDIDTDHDIIVKIDIDGDEWQVLETLSAEQMSRFRQIVVECHWIHNFGVQEDWRNQAMNVVRKLAQTHQVVHVHGNNNASFALLGGIPFPEVFELTLVRKDRHIFSKTYRT